MKSLTEQQVGRRKRGNRTIQEPFKIAHLQVQKTSRIIDQRAKAWEMEQGGKAN